MCKQFKKPDLILRDNLCKEIKKKFLKAETFFNDILKAMRKTQYKTFLN